MGSAFLAQILQQSSEVGYFWWKELSRLHLLYKGIARCSIGDGALVTFWEDLLTTKILAIKFPRLFSFASNASLRSSRLFRLMIWTSSSTCHYQCKIMMSCWSWRVLLNKCLLIQMTRISGPFFWECITLF